MTTKATPFLQAVFSFNSGSDLKLDTTAPSMSHVGFLITSRDGNKEWMYGIIDSDDGHFYPVDGSGDFDTSSEGLIVIVGANADDRKSHYIQVTVRSAYGDTKYRIKGKKDIKDTKNGVADVKPPEKPYPRTAVELINSIRTDYPNIARLLSYDGLTACVRIDAFDLIDRVPTTLATDKSAFRERYAGGMVPMDDTLNNLLKQYISYLHKQDGCNSPPTGIKDTVFDQAVQSLADCNTVHPFLDRVKSVPWDGTPRLATHFQDCLGAYCDELDDAEQSEYFANLAINWFVGVVARQHHECKLEILPVIYGDQGIGKTDYTRAMALGAEFVSEIDGEVGPNEGVRELVERFRGSVIVDVVEGSWLFNTSSQQIKGMISATKDKARMAYAHYESIYRRTFGFLCSTNEKGFCKDPTGDRRIYPFEATGQGSVDYRHDAYYCQQCWAEALWYFNEAYLPELEKTSEWQIVLSERMERVLGPKAREPFRDVRAKDEIITQVLDAKWPLVGDEVSFNDIIRELLNTPDWALSSTSDTQIYLSKYMKNHREWKAMGRKSHRDGGNQGYVFTFARVPVRQAPKSTYSRPTYTACAYDSLPYRIWLTNYAKSVVGAVGSSVKPRADPSADFSRSSLPMVRCLLSVLADKGILETKAQTKSVTIYRTVVGVDSPDRDWEEHLPTRGDAERKMTAIQDFYAFVHDNNITVGDTVEDDGRWAGYRLTEDHVALFGADTPDSDWDELIPAGHGHNELSKTMVTAVTPSLPEKHLKLNDFM